MDITNEIYKLLKKENFSYADLEKAYTAAALKQKKEEAIIQKKKAAIDTIAEQFKILVPQSDKEIFNRCIY